MTSRKVDLSIPNVSYPTRARGLVLGADGRLPATVLPIGGGVLDTKVDKDSVVVAATRIVASKLLAGDAQPAFQILGDGRHNWGPGGAGVTDVSVYRGAANTLRIAPNVRIDGYLDVAFTDTGQLRFGSALDTNLYRVSAGLLRTDGHLAVGSTGTPFAYATGASLSSAGAVLAVPSAGGSTAFYVGVNGGSTFNWLVRGDGQMQWGGGDTLLYRAGAGFLRTDGTLQVGSTAGTGIHFLASVATNTVVMTGKMIGGALGALTTTLEVKIDGVSYRIPVYV